MSDMIHKSAAEQADALAAGSVTSVELVQAHRSTIIFVNSRGLCERLAHRLNEQDRRFVMFVGDLAEDFLDQILDRDQPLGTRIFVEHDGKVHLLAAHFLQQFEHTHRFGNVERLADQRGDAARRTLGIHEAVRALES